MNADLFFIYGLFFLIGVLSFQLFNFWFLINLFLLLSLIFFSYFIIFNKLTKFKIFLLINLFLFLGLTFGFLRSNLNIQLKQPKFFLSYRQFIEDKVKNYLPFPEENIFRSILFGSKIEDKEIKNNFINGGLIHITAVSGQNLTIMFSLFYEFFKKIPLFTPNSLFFFSILLIFFFVSIMGFAGNVLRAAIMAFFILLIKTKFGRIPLKRNIFLLTAIIFSLINPLLLLQDIGTQFSFLAMMGIIYLAPAIEKSFNFLKINLLRKITSETISAQITTFPLILYYFGNFNLWSLLSNILVVPLLPHFMQLATLFLLIPLKPLIWLTLPFLKYFLLIAEIFGQSFIYFKIPLIIVIVTYFFIFFEFYWQNKNEGRDFRFNLG